MLTPFDLWEMLNDRGIQFYCGVPDSLLKSFCGFLSDTLEQDNHHIVANEGGAISLAVGYHLATNKVPLVYMQNSGLGNAVNPLLSLADPKVYSIPMLLLIGWRGEPGSKDEPQHMKQGEVTLKLLNAIGIKSVILEGSKAEVKKQITFCVNYALKNNAPIAILVKKNSFDSYKMNSLKVNDFKLTRERAIELIVASLPKDSIFVSTTGKISRELYETRTKNMQDHDHDFLTVGSMGHASQIALGVALKKHERMVICLDGDGAMLMHMGGLAIIGSLKLQNYTHFILNNGAHDSVGGQPTVGYEIDAEQLAKSCGYRKAWRIDDEQALQLLLDKQQFRGPCLINVIVRRGSREDLGRPTTTPRENKSALMDTLGKV
jgi:phosphonopyruvate decarboxylase